MNDWEQQRHRMVDMQLMTRGITDPATLQAMRDVPRHHFVPEPLQRFAYEDGPLPIGAGQTISQPYIVALMAQEALLTPKDKVLEIGTGSGYAAAVASRIVKEVFTIERVPALAENAQRAIESIDYTNIHVRVDDGSIGWVDEAPFDAIIVTAGAPELPQSLVEQLSENGRIVIPVGDAIGQYLYRYQKNPEGDLRREFLEYVRFVPLIGKEGWEAGYGV